MWRPRKISSCNSVERLRTFWWEILVSWRIVLLITSPLFCINQYFTSSIIPVYREARRSSLHSWIKSNGWVDGGAAEKLYQKPTKNKLSPENRIFCLLVHGVVQQCVAIRRHEKLCRRPRLSNWTNQLHKCHHGASFECGTEGSN